MKLVRSKFAWIMSLSTSFVLMTSTLAATAADVVDTASEDVLAREDQLTPQDLGAEDMDGLQFADPAEQLVMVDAPEANNQGTAELAYPIAIPPGRAGVEPELALSYDSSAGNGWLGVGWDLGVGEIAVDTRWGVPRYNTSLESETYLLDGDVLAPTAVRTSLQDRVSDRDDWTRRIETEFERIIRHGDNPTNYWWEVTDKEGTTRYYGADLSGNQVDSAILSDDAGNGYQWNLTAVVDISGNTVRYEYERVDGTNVGVGAIDYGTQLYLKSILYTGFTDSALDDPPYEVRFVRDADLAEPARPDVSIDATGGAPVVTSELLRRIEIWHGQPNGGAPRTYDELAGAYELNYEVAAYGKTILTSVEQRGGDDAVYGTHTFDYYDDVRPNGTDYDGFADPENWNTGNDGLSRQLITESVGVSVLGASETNSGDGHAYIGFNPTAVPGKTNSFGGSFNVGGGDTKGLSEMMDINGDLLPDEVFLEGSTVRFRLNQSGPGGTTTFGPKGTVANLSSLSTESEVNFGGALEAHPFGASVQFSISGAYSTGPRYFTDANSDGLPDFVDNGVVYFNRLDNGVPTFDTSSALTAVPIDAATASPGALDVLAEIEQEQRDSSALQDTVRRWVAPFAGTVAVTGAVTLDPTVVVEGDPPSEPPYAGDGVRVAIQRNGSELWTTTLTGDGDVAVPAGVGSVSVAKGDRLYFRVGSIDDGARDQVQWDPTITYVGSPSLDENGLSQSIYTASDEFTLTGRPGTKITLPVDGTLEFEATLKKTAATSDDLTVTLLKNGAAVSTTAVDWDTVDATGINLDTSFAVAALDELELRIEVDSPIDVTTLDWMPIVYYSASPDTQVIDDEGDPTILLAMPYHIDIYPQNTLGGFRSPFVASADATETVVGAVGPSFFLPAGTEVVLTVKQQSELVAKGSFTTNLLGVGGVSFDVDFVEDEEYWFDLTFQVPSDPADVEDVALGAATVPSAVTVGGSATAHVRHWAPGQGIFPLPYRGWAYAGYNGAGSRATSPIVESDFDFDESNYPTSEPGDFNEAGYQNPAEADATAFYPDKLDLLAGDGTVAETVPIWRGSTDSMVGGAGFARSSRTGVESPGVSVGAGARAPVRFSWTGPSLALVLSIFAVSGSGGAGVSRGYADYVDLNGDGFPDYVAENYVEYTGPRGGYVDSSTDIGQIYQDTTFAFSGGFNGNAVEIEANAKGDANNGQDTPAESGNAARSPGGSSAGTGEDAGSSEYGAELGLGATVSGAFTNPASNSDTVQDIINALDFLAGDQLELELADMNGDDLPDRVRVSGGNVYVTLNLGYGFDSQEILWSSGSFEQGESWTGDISPGLGFNINKREFAGGLSLTESIDLPRYQWIDVDADGAPDRLRKADNGDIRVAFSTGAGVGPEIDYGDFVEGDVDIFGIPVAEGQQIALGESTGAGGGLDFTISIGPLCLPSPNCYIIINPGGSFEHTVSKDQIELTDIDGDGYPDSVKSNDDASMVVHRNNRGRTHLLRQVTNPIGGEIRISYTRDGNTVAQPYPLWTMSSVAVDDNRPGDGPDTLVSNYSYAGNAYDSLEREFLGYSTVVEEHSTSVGGAALRKIEQTYLNGNVFEVGLLSSETELTPGDVPLASTEITWEFVIARTTDPLVLGTPVSNLARSGAPQQARIDQKWYDDTGTVRQSTYTELDYDHLGNVVKIFEEGETEWDDDDLLIDITYPDCEATTWVSVPATYTATDVFNSTVMRHRDGSKDLCANAVVTELIEQIDGGAQAVTNLAFDAFGSYNQIIYPANANGERFTVDYVYDADRNTDVVQVTDSHGLTATATYDWSTGLPLSRTDVNGNSTTYTYDPLGRVTSITGPYEQGTGNATISFEYFPTDPDYAYAVARHFDVFNPGDTIDTATFVDGIGRETQTKQDATVFQGAATTAADVMVVGGAVVFDDLGRPVLEGYPITEPLGTIGTYNTGISAEVTAFSWTLRDKITSITRPDGAVTTTGYDYGDDGFGAELFVTTTTDPLGKSLVAYSDVGDNVFGMFEVASPTEQIKTRYAYDVLDQLVAITDNGGNVSTYTYDMLGRRTTVDTPDGGLRVWTYDASDNVVAFEDAVSRAAGQLVTYDYDFERLIAINYQDGTPDVDYTYGGPGAPGNAAGQLTSIVDGAKERTLTYDLLGLVASETSTMLVHNLNDNIAERVTFETTFTYESFGRLGDLTYPDGEVVSHDYDSGGLLKSVAGVKGTDTYPYVDRLEYDEFSDRRYLGFGHGVETTYEYDAAVRWLDRITTVTPAREIQDVAYTYDAVGNMLQADNQVPDPTPSLMGGPSTQDYEYDGFYRLVGATGTAAIPPNKRRDYSYAVEYDDVGNIVTKSQLDEIFTGNGKKGVEQRPTTYDFDYSYDATGPHQISQLGTHSFTHDANGNFTGWTDDRTGQNRSVTWDSEDRVTSVADQGSTTTYKYDAENRLSIERGPSGETSFVNRWYTARNGTVAWKHVFAGDQRVATKRVFNDGVFEHQLYFFHQDLLGNTTIVTDDLAEVFQRVEYFPAGEIWIQEHNTIFRTPYLYADGYFDEFRDLINLGERWYDPREQFMYSPDPVLYSDPDDAIIDPALLPAYSYAQSNPLSMVDTTGRVPQLGRHRLGNGLRSLSVNASPAAAANPDATDPDGRSSRLEQRTAPAPDDSTRGAIKLSEALGSSPLVKFTFEKTKGSDDGWTLTETEISPLFAGPSITFPRGEDTPDAGESGPAADTGMPAPGTGGAAAMAGGMDDLSQPSRPASVASVGDADSTPPADSDTP